uniref:cytochrome P450 n=2 Tax=Protofrankia TaxID=2994361 RepID=UPI0005BC93F0
NFIYTLLARRQYWQRLVDNPELVPQAVEELSRYIPLDASAKLARIATEDIELGGQLVRAGEALLVQLDSANRDEAVFDHPNELDFDRADNPHIAFGHGAHHCLGAPLARLELQVALGTLVRRLPGLRLAVPADEVQWRSDRLVRALPVRW